MCCLVCQLSTDEDNERGEQKAEEAKVGTARCHDLRMDM